MAYDLQARLDLELQKNHEGNDQLANYSIEHETKDLAFLDAPTPKTVNSRSASIASYLDEMSLPSVSIDNAETGVVRWRTFPKNEERTRTARKLDFRESAESLHEPSVVFGVEDTSLEIPETMQSLEYNNKVSDQDNPNVMMSELKPNSKIYDPVISSLSTEDFFRLHARGGTREEVFATAEMIPVHDCPVEPPRPGCHSPNLIATTTKTMRATSPSYVVDSAKASTIFHKELKNGPDSKPRKVGRKIDNLVAQLKERGLELQ